MMKDGRQSGTNLLAVLAPERNVTLIALVVVVQALGENLWHKFIPKYLESLGAPVLVIGIYGTLYDLLDGLYQYPGGWLSDRIGRTRALVVFLLVAAAGYATYALATTWHVVLAGMLFATVWHSMATPTVFAVIGDALPRGQRAMAFTVQSLFKRMPMAVAPVIGGLLIARFGVGFGVRVSLVTAIVLSGVALLMLTHVRLTVLPHEAVQLHGVWRTFPHSLRTLLLSDVVVRTCEGLVDVFLVIYATTVIGISAARFGILIAVSMVTAIVVYLPAARLADRIGRKPLVILTFLCFALFPLAVVMSNGFRGLIAAYVVGGLREIGEPARKALIVDLADARLRGRSVGLYYFVRSTAVAPAAAIGGLLWQISPAFPFYFAALIGLGGAIIFALTVKEEDAV